MDMAFIIQLIAGALGGNAAGAVLKNLNLGRKLRRPGWTHP